MKILLLTSMENTASYQQLADSAFEEYKSRLNWQIAGKTVKALLEDIIA